MSGRAGYHLGQKMAKMSNHGFVSKRANRISKTGYKLGMLVSAGGALVMIWATDIEFRIPGFLTAVAGIVLVLLTHWIAIRIEHTSPLPSQGRYPLGTLFYGLDFRPLGAVCKDDYFDASTRQVEKLAHSSEGSQCVRGCSIVKIPDSVQTAKALYSFLTSQEHVHNAGATPTLRLYWRNRQKTLTFRQSRITVGRESDNTLTFTDSGWNKYLSRHHAEFFFRDGQWYLMDMKSVNHTFVNQKQLQPHKSVLLRKGDVIQFASGDPFLFDPPRA